MKIDQVRKAMKTATLTLVACKITDKLTSYLKVDIADLELALTELEAMDIKEIRADLAQPSNVLYIGD